ncbi:hypothetical protein B0J13DRAFT_212849 [Dactylonectria estremocensis]|uniref:RecQ mediated genome instability protein 1-like N-terminal helical domain-containing protein n=1 Tax=Dactylonectria estremocensis TaxID=1079267 RepID=A0A9P9JBV2_9HYPO|nr:hypothetical protein B0J13DRAFT_212849 [Dactylonectria estremocensis]
MDANVDLTGRLRAAILAQSLPYPSTAFLASLTTARSPPPPLPSLVATAKARLLAADLSSSALLGDAAGSLPSLPPGADAAAARELRLPRPVHVQVVDVENLSLSRWEQIEELEAVERGETTRGREVVRITGDDNDNENGESSPQTQPQTQRPATRTPTATGIRPAGKTATHRLVLQDCKGAKVYALELKRIDSIGVGKTQMGEKMLLKTGTVIARGTVLLEPDKCVLLGGKIDAWQRAWMDGRLARLREAVSQDDAQRA